MGTILVQGKGDGKNIALSINGNTLQAQHVRNVPSGSCFYLILRVTSFSGTLNGASVKPGQLLGFEFDGDLGSYSGYYRLLEGQEATRVLGSQLEQQPEREENPFQNNVPVPPKPKPVPKPQPQPQPKPKPVPQPQRQPEPEPEPSDYTPALAEPNEGGGFYIVMRNICYVLGILWGLATPIVLIYFIMKAQGIDLWDVLGQIGSWSRTDGSSFTMFLLILIPSFMFCLLSSISCILCLVKGRDSEATIHYGVILIGLVNLNLLAMLGGLLNHRYMLHRYKMKPVKQ